MNQQCESCKRTFQLAEMIKISMMLSLYPVESRARFCPYCGLDDNGQSSANAALVEVLQRLLPRIQYKAQAGACVHDALYGDTWEGLYEDTRAALARVGVADEEGE
jgi:hypothetical protein